MAPLAPALLLLACLAASACERTPGPAPEQSGWAGRPWPEAAVDTLIRLGREDQAGRNRLARSVADGDTALLRVSIAGDSARSLWLRQVVRRYGWPAPAAAGDSAARAAWLILQHTPLRDWQEELLPTLEALAATGQLRPADFAMFLDRLLVQRGAPQRYGTQFDLADGRLVPAPIADTARLDERRAAAGLPPMADYARMLAEQYGMEVAWPARP
jgi:hypothetical protein